VHIGVDQPPPRSRAFVLPWPKSLISIRNRIVCQHCQRARTPCILSINMSWRPIMIKLQIEINSTVCDEEEKLDSVCL
jgi:hypothetical protein